MVKGPNILKYSNWFTSPFFRTISHLGSLSHGRLDQMVLQGPFQPGPFYDSVMPQVAVLRGSFADLRCWYRSTANKPVCLAFGPNQSCHSSLKYCLSEASVGCWATSNIMLVTFFSSAVRTFIHAGVICV